MFGRSECLLMLIPLATSPARASGNGQQLCCCPPAPAGPPWWPGLRASSSRLCGASTAGIQHPFGPLPGVHHPAAHTSSHLWGAPGCRPPPCPGILAGCSCTTAARPCSPAAAAAAAGAPAPASRQGCCKSMWCREVAAGTGQAPSTTNPAGSSPSCEGCLVRVCEKVRCRTAGQGSLHHL